MSETILDELAPTLEPSFYGTPDYEDDKPEPQVAVGAPVLDRDGVVWVRHPLGWVVSGDARPQAWREVQRWFN